MELQLINHKSKWLKSVQLLGDSYSNTVGFLAQEAYADYARKGRILVAIHDNQLLAYTMFRFKKNSIVIVHLCVAPKYKGQHIPSRMINWLLEENKENISHIQLACRRDYNIDPFWQKLGFSAVGEKTGRAVKNRTILTIWVKENQYCKNLFAQINGADDTKVLVVLDTNIVIDLCEGDQLETNYLRQDFLATYADFRITRFLVNEINSCPDESIRNKHRSFAVNNYPMLDAVNDDLFNRVKGNLLSKKPCCENSNTWYDIVHIAQSIAAGAEVFITRDSAWLNNDISEYIKREYGMSILSPGELIGSIDEINSPSDYAPLKLAGLNLEYSRLSTTDFALTVTTFHQLHGSKKSDFEKRLRQWVAAPNLYTVLLIKANTKPICLITYSTCNHIMTIETLLIHGKEIKPSLQQTFIKRIAFKILDQAYTGNLQVIQILKSGLSDLVLKSFRECGFFDCDTSLTRLINIQILSVTHLSHIPSLPTNSPLNLAIDALRNDFSNGISCLEQITNLEKALWPLKISDARMPCYIVPIKASYAVQLFDENLANQETCLFENEKTEPALSIENVYFKAKAQSIPDGPARILWYVSSSKYIGTPAIRACSYLDRVEKGSKEELFKKYRRLGVLDWPELTQIEDGKELTAYIFSYTELFSTPVKLDTVRQYISRPKESFQSFRSISEQAFLRIYQEGTQGDHHAK